MHAHRAFNRVRDHITMVNGWRSRSWCSQDIDRKKKSKKKKPLKTSYGNQDVRMIWDDVKRLVGVKGWFYHQMFLRTEPDNRKPVGRLASQCKESVNTWMQ